mgnify:CR=1 FL=1
MNAAEPKLLIASPEMADPFFEKTVVLVWHYDEEGAIGVIVNRPLSEARARGIMPDAKAINLPDVLVMDDEVDMAPYAENEVAWGGPVDLESGTIVALGEIEEHEGWKLPDGVAVTRSQDALVRLIADRAKLRLCLGYAGWGPGQLDQEIADGGWLFTDVDPRLLFEVQPEECWEAAIASLGIQSSWISMKPIEA